MTKLHVLSIAFALLVGCAGAAPKSQPSPSSSAPPGTMKAAARSEFAAFPCDPRVGGDNDPVHELRSRGRALSIAVPVDSLLVKRVSGDQREVMAESGTPCSGATDAAACRSAIAELERKDSPATTPCGDFRCEERAFAITTRGDVARLWITPAQIRELLGPIDSPADAWLLMQADKREPPYLCGDADYAAQRVVEGGYELRVRRYTNGCRPLEQIEVVYRVGRDGAVQLLSNKVILSEPEGCAQG